MEAAKEQGRRLTTGWSWLRPDVPLEDGFVRWMACDKIEEALGKGRWRIVLRRNDVRYLLTLRNTMKKR